MIYDKNEKKIKHIVCSETRNHDHIDIGVNAI